MNQWVFWDYIYKTKGGVPYRSMNDTKATTSLKVHYRLGHNSLHNVEAVSLYLPTALQIFWWSEFPSFAIVIACFIFWRSIVKPVNFSSDLWVLFVFWGLRGPLPQPTKKKRFTLEKINTKSTRMLYFSFSKLCHPLFYYIFCPLNVFHW